MSADLEQFYEVFFEESSELLAEMEACLLGLDISSPDPEDLNAIFRAAHSIKGGAGTFGFTDMTEMTHMLESLLDKIRKGEIEIRSEMIDTFLKAGDVIKGQLEAHKGNGEADVATAAEVSMELKQFSEESNVPPVALKKETVSTPAEIAEPIPADTKVGGEDTKSVPASPEQETSSFKIEFSTSGINPKSMENLFSNLNAFGKLEKLLESSEEQICQLRLTTGASEEDVWEALAFVVDPTQLTIEKETGTTSQSSIHEDNATADHTDEAIAEPSNSTPVESVIQTEGSMCEPYGFFPGAPAAPNGTEKGTGKTEKVETNLQSENNQKASPNATSQNTVQKQPKSNAPASESSSIRVSIEKVDQMINLVGELVITQAMLAQTASEVDPVIYEKLNNGMNQLERNTRDLQEAVMSIRMLPISFVFSRYPRVVRDLAAKLDKKVELKTVGEGTELDKGLIEKIADPLTHLVRNSLDHGIESPEKRIAAGKLAKGTITLRAFHQGGSIIIEVGDDGAGLNREKIMAKAMERGISVHDGMTDQEVWMLIFEAGFSTAEQVTDVSGRGVGMDVVKRNIQDMGGRVEIDSVFGVSFHPYRASPISP
ncbi:MAG: Hpt domain-containing protein [Burkholderiales bacterium]|nr:Hpt domain-containing protein [Nitrosomonas sp.]MCP5273575.1 Hpt domain-containing protein [Burkholderiales bacterium]